MMIDLEKLKASIRPAEKFEPKPYRDIVGKLTIGYGRNLEDRGITIQEAEMMLENDIADTIRQLEDEVYFKAVRGDDVRSRVLIEMAFNMGEGGLEQFKKFLKFVEIGQYTLAAAEMLDSKWARQVGSRAVRLAKMMEKGVDF